MAGKLTLEEFYNSAPPVSVSSVEGVASGKKLSLDDFYDVPETEEKGFIARMGEDIDERIDDIESNVIGYGTGKKSYSEALTSIPQNLAGAVPDTIGNAIGSVGRYAQDVGEAVAPDITQVIINTGKEAAAKIGETIAPAIATYQSFAEGNPVGANLTSMYGNLGIGAGGTAGGKPLIKGTGNALDAAGNAVTKSASALDSIKLANDFYTKLKIPEQTLKETKNASRDILEFGINKKQYVLPNDNDLEVIEVLKKIPKISPKNSVRGNATVIGKELEKENNFLNDVLTKSNIKVPVVEYQGQLKVMREGIEKVEGITDEMRKHLLKPLDVMEQTTARNSGNISLKELMEARRTLDTELEIASGEKLTPAIQKVYYKGVKGLRDYTNEFIASKVPDVDVLDSLKKQSALIRAEKDILPKAHKEPKTRGERIAKTLDESMPLKGLGRGGGLGYAGRAAIGAAMLPVVAIKAGIDKITQSPKLRRALGITLTRSGQFLKGGKEIAPEEVVNMAHEMKLLPAPDRTSPNVVLGSGKAIKDTAFSKEDLILDKSGKLYYKGQEVPKQYKSYILNNFKDIKTKTK